VSELLEVAVVGRPTPESLEPLARRLDQALEGEASFAVLFDRRAMTAPTPEARTALEQWAQRTMPRLPGRCAAWADVLDERGAGSLARARGVDGRADQDAEPDLSHGYPQRTFTDEGCRPGVGDRRPRGGLRARRAPIRRGRPMRRRRPSPLALLRQQRLSAPRLATYVRATGGDLDGAVELYLWNAAVAGALWEGLGHVEAVLRNVLRDALTARHPRLGWARQWYDDPARELAQHARDDITRATQRLHRAGAPLLPGKIVAELNFGFWRFLLARRYTATLWPALRPAFPYLPGSDRRLLEAPSPGCTCGATGWLTMSRCWPNHCTTATPT
jgi:hypothetical protein